MGVRTYYPLNIRRISSILTLLLILIVDIHVMNTNTMLSRKCSVSKVSQDSSNPPIIEWPHSPINATYTPAIFWDGAYTGQTQEVWSWTYWVNDTDGVDTVLFRFHWGYEDEWFDRSTVQVEGNSTNGRYKGNLTWGVEWDWEEGRPEWVDGSGTFWFKVWANDTLGNWNETPSVHFMGGYMIVNPPPLYWVLIIGQILIIPVLVVIILVIIWKRRKS